jgi:hypothetical protein
LAFLGETIGDDLPLLVEVQAPTDTAGDQNLSFSFGLREVAVLTKAKIIAYFKSEGAGNLMNPIAMTAANTVRLTQLCPVPHAWAAYFLDSRTPYKSWQIGAQLIFTLDMANDRDRVLGRDPWY